MSGNNVFVQVMDLINYENRRVNIMGIVTEFSIPRKSKGTDYVSVLKIVDGSQQTPELSVNIFTQTLDELPHIKSYGDFIVLYSVMIKRHNGELYALFNKNTSSFALLDGIFTVGIRPYQTSSKCSSLEPDKNIIIYWRKWCRSSQIGAGTMQYVLSLKDIYARGFFDLVCKVLHICEVSSDVWMLFVWDGTDIPPPSLHMTCEHDHNLLPSQIESLSLPLDIVSSFPLLGTIFGVIADKVYEKLGQHFQGNNKWIRIRNITCEVRSGLWYGLLTPSSKIRLLPDNDDIVSERKRNYINRIKEMGRVPSSTSPSISLAVTLKTEKEELEYCSSKGSCSLFS